MLRRTFGSAPAVTRGLLVVVASLVGCNVVVGIKDVPNIDDAAPDSWSPVDGGSPDSSGDATLPPADASGDTALHDAGDTGSSVGDTGSPLDAGDASAMDAADAAGRDASDAQVPDAGDAGCSNSCTPGVSECTTLADAAATLNCQRQPNGCYAPVTASCGANRTCAVPSDGGAVSCACAASFCTHTGEFCQNGAASIATCAADSNGCLYVASVTSCASGLSCAQSGDDASCSPTCSNGCSSGQTACGTVDGGAAGLETCAVGDSGCLALAPPVACPSGAYGGTCSVATGSAACCQNACTPGSAQCVTTDAGVIAEACEVLAATGCAVWTPVQTCGLHQTCSADGGVAACNCNVDTRCGGAASNCVGGELVVCGSDPQGCLFSDAGPQPCSNGTCIGGAGSASCCVNPCVLGTTQCGGGGTGVETCTAVAGACNTWAGSVGCGSHQTCSGSGTGSAACACTDGGCSVVGTSCEGANVVACDSDGTLLACPYVAASVSCSTACFVDAGTAECCPSAACTAGTLECSPTGFAESCGTEPSGCVGWLPPASCDAGSVCERGPGTCLDEAWAEWTMPNSPLDVDGGAQHVQQYTVTTTSYGPVVITDNVTGLMWLSAVPLLSDGGPILETQTNAIAYCAGLNTGPTSGNGGYTNWRLPTAIELISILDESRYPNLMMDPAFGAAPAAAFMTQTLVAGSGGGVFVVEFAVGTYGPYGGNGAVRCVR